jgi:small-conductance mechanosensitive channel
MNELLNHASFINIIGFINEFKLLASLMLLAVVLMVKQALVSVLRRRYRRGANKRVVVNSFKNIVNLLLLVFLISLWSSELQSLAFSIAAFIVAIVLATREFIQCFLGYLYAISARPFRVGDWVQLNHVSGEVVELDWAKVTVLEIDEHSMDYTGRHLYIPNSLIVTKTVINLNFLKRYAIHQFKVTLEPHSNPYEILPQLLDRARHYCDDFRDVAERYKGLIERQLDTEFIEIEPDISVETNQFGKYEICVSLFCPAEQKDSIQQKITADIFLHWFDQAPDLVPLTSTLYAEPNGN